MDYFENTILQQSHGTVFLDIDGTLVPDGESEIRDIVIKRVQALKENYSIYLLTNDKDKTRVCFLAEKIGIQFINSKLRKPDPRLVKMISGSVPRPYIIIGDKLLTDGLFAYSIGGVFIKVRRIYSGKESWKQKIVYALDDIFDRLHRLIIRDY